MEDGDVVVVFVLTRVVVVMGLREADALEEDVPRMVAVVDTNIVVDEAEDEEETRAVVIVDVVAEL